MSRGQLANPYSRATTNCAALSWKAAGVVGHSTAMVAGQPREGVGVAGPDGPLQGTGLPAEAVEVGTVGHVQGRHNGLLSSA